MYISTQPALCVSSVIMFLFRLTVQNDEKLEKMYQDYMAGKDKPSDNETPVETSNDETKKETAAESWDWEPETDENDEKKKKALKDEEDEEDVDSLLDGEETPKGLLIRF